MQTGKRVYLALIISLVLLGVGILLVNASAQSGYNPDFDVAEPWGQIDVIDIQMVASNWDAQGEYTDAHNHWGETWTGSGFGLLFNGNSALPIFRSNNAGSGAALVGQSSSGNGVYGQSDSTNTAKAGVYGYGSEHTAGVYGESVHGDGIVGDGGDEAGDFGGEFNGHGGVKGVGEVESGGYFTSDNTHGVYGWSDLGNGGNFRSETEDGVAGISPAAGQAGVSGYNSGSGMGVHGSSLSGYGGYFQSSTGTALYVAGAAEVEDDLSVTGNLIGGSHTHSGGDIASGTVADARIASTIARDSEITYETLNANGDVGAGASQVAAGNHNHDSRYYTEAEADSRFAAATHQHDASYSALGHDHFGETWSGSGAGLTIQGDDALDGALIAENSGGGPAVYVGEGGLSSEGHSYIWVPGSLAHPYQAAPALAYVEAGGVQFAGGPSIAEFYVDIPVVLPAVLYGRPVRVMGLRIPYKASGSNACILDTRLYVQADVETYNLVAGTANDHCSTVASNIDVAANTSLHADRGPVWLRLFIHLEDLTSMTIGGVRVELAH